MTASVASYGESRARGRWRSYSLQRRFAHVVSCLLCLPMHVLRPRLSGASDCASNCDLSYVLRTQAAALIMSRAAGSRLRHSLAALARCGGPPSVEEAIRAAHAPWTASPPWHLAGGGGGSCLWRQRAVAASSSAAAPQPPSVRRSKGPAAKACVLCCRAPAGVWCCSTPACQPTPRTSICRHGRGAWNGTGGGAAAAHTTAAAAAAAAAVAVPAQLRQRQESRLAQPPPLQWTLVAAAPAAAGAAAAAWRSEESAWET